VRVCERWSKFENFIADMGRRPSSKHSIDRIDSAGDYKPENCRWATIEVQNNNTRRNHFIEVDGERLTVAQWARRLGLDPSAIFKRMSLGWTEREAATRPRTR